MAGSLNIKSISRKVINSKKREQEMHKRAEMKLQNAKNIMINEFESHPVSVEIAGGSGASNSSRTLGGYGNLFTFIGFPAGARPIAKIADLIRRQTYLLKRGPRGKASGRNVVKNYRINYMDEGEIADTEAARMPWESGSWINAIEQGMSSFSYYMYKNFEGSRSRKGLQAKKGGKSGGSLQKINDGSFSPMKYVSQIIRNFRSNIYRK